MGQKPSAGGSPTRAAKVGAVMLAVLGAGAGLASCAQFPTTGPDATTVMTHAAPLKPDGYSLVRVTPDVLRAIAAQPRTTLSDAFAGGPAPDQVIGVGDIVSITVWDFGGLLSAPSAQQGQVGAAPSAGAPLTTMPAPTQPLPVAGTSTIPAQVVDQNGNVMVPYGGSVHAAGLSTAALQGAITSALKPVMIHPQVLVVVSQNQSNLVTVGGDVAHPGRVPISLGGMRLLDAIALSGGTTYPASDVTVRVTRAGVTTTTRLDTVSSTPTENIYLRANDLVVLDRAPQSVVVLGATNHNAQVPFGKSDFTLAEALGNGGGLTDVQADPFGVFVFRYEAPPALKALGLRASLGAGPTMPSPVVYQINLQTPEGLFMAQSFQLHDRDVVYVSNSDSVQLTKMLRLILLGASLFKTSAVVSN